MGNDIDTWFLGKTPSSNGLATSALPCHVQCLTAWCQGPGQGPRPVSPACRAFEQPRSSMLPCLPSVEMRGRRAFPRPKHPGNPLRIEPCPIGRHSGLDTTRELGEHTSKHPRTLLGNGRPRPNYPPLSRRPSCESLAQ
jgi:hypothetical protein